MCGCPNTYRSFYILGGTLSSSKGEPSFQQLKVNPVLKTGLGEFVQLFHCFPLSSSPKTNSLVSLPEANRVAKSELK